MCDETRIRDVDTLSGIQKRIAAIKSANDVRLGHARALGQQGKDAQQAQEAAERTVEVLTRAVGVLNAVSEERAAQAQETIEGLVTKGLQGIFGSDLSFHIASSVKGKAVNSDLVIRTTLDDGSHVDTAVLDARGGGLAATVGVLLRVVLILLDSGQPRLLVLDEPFAHVSAEYEGPLADFLAELVRGTGIQIIMVTHSDAYVEVADVVYRFGQQNGRTIAVKERFEVLKSSKKETTEEAG